MKRFLLVLALCASSLFANAFEFDGIDLNAPTNTIYREIAKRGYSYNHERNCLDGLCQGVRIYLSTNYIDVSEQGRLGQLIVEMPVVGDPEGAFANIASVFNVIYHRLAGGEGDSVYQVDNDGTQMVLSQKSGFVVLTYNTPYYKKPE